MRIKILYIFRVSKKIVKMLFYKFVFGAGFKINIFSSYLSLKLNIINGSFVLGSNVKNKSNLNVSINGGDLTIGNNVFFNNYVSINCRRRIVIGDNNLIGENVCFYDHNHCFREEELIRSQGYDLEEIIIGSNVWIGSNTVILPGVIVGNNVVIAAGSIVTKSVPSNSIFLQKRDTNISIK